jgi:hypothetical protein
MSKHDLTPMLGEALWHTTINGQSIIEVSKNHAHEVIDFKTPSSC